MNFLLLLYDKNICIFVFGRMKKKTRKKKKGIIYFYEVGFVYNADIYYFRLSFKTCIVEILFLFCIKVVVYLESIPCLRLRENGYIVLKNVIKINLVLTSF